MYLYNLCCGTPQNCMVLKRHIHLRAFKISSVISAAEFSKTRPTAPNMYTKTLQRGTKTDTKHKLSQTITKLH